MNEQAQQALANLPNIAIDGGEGAKTFAEAQIPDVVEQLLIWKMLESLAHIFIPLLLFLASAATLATVLVKINKAKKSRDDDGCYPYHPNLWWASHGWSDTAIVATIASAATTFLSFLVTVVFINLTWLQILVAPKIYLLEYASNLVK